MADSNCVTFPEATLALQGQWLLHSMIFGSTKKPPDWVLQFDGGADFKVTKIGDKAEKPGQERICGVIHAWDPPGPSASRPRVITIEFHKNLSATTPGGRGLTVCCGSQVGSWQQPPKGFAGFYQDSGGGGGSFTLFPLA